MTTKWKYQAEMINACNCDWGCPCNFNAKPTNGFCEGTYGAHITSGFCGDARLDGLEIRVEWQVAAGGPRGQWHREDLDRADARPSLSERLSRGS